MDFVYDDLLARYSTFFRIYEGVEKDGRLISQNSSPDIAPIDKTWDLDQFHNIIVLILR